MTEEQAILEVMYSGKYDTLTCVQARIKIKELISKNNNNGEKNNEALD